MSRAVKRKLSVQLISEESSRLDWTPRELNVPTSVKNIIRNTRRVARRLTRLRSGVTLADLLVF